MTGLRLKDTALAPQDGVSLERLRNLVFLEVSSNTIVDGSLRPVAKLPRLSLLVLRCPRLTAKGLADLRGAKIHGLELSGVQFDDETIAVIRSLPLRVLTCWDDTISDADIEKLRRLKPELQIVVARKEE